MSNQRGDPPKDANNVAKVLTKTTSTITTSIENYSKVVSSTASLRDSVIDCRCTTHIWGHHLMFITHTVYPPYTNKVKKYNKITSFASRYGNVRLIWQLPDGKMEMVIHQELVQLPGSFNFISQSHKMKMDDN
jgi:hypothetical protein